MALFLNDVDVETLLTMPDAVDALEGAIREQGLKIATNKPRQIVKTKTASCSVLQAAVPGLHSLGFKTYTVGPEGARFWLMLFGDDGDLQSLMEAENLGMIRTGAATAVATKYMAKEDSKTVGILGTGFQAPAQLEAVCAVRKIERAKVWSKTRANVDAFCAKMSKQLGIAVEPAADAKAAVSDVDVVVTITSSKDPVMKGAWLAPGTHVNLVGAMKPAYKEVDTETLTRADLLVADDWHQAHEEAGEFIIADQEGKLDWTKVHELCEVVAGTGPKRTSKDSITVFKSHGVGLWDVAAASRVYKIAREKGAGIELPIKQAVKVLGGGRDPERMKV